MPDTTKSGTSFNDFGVDALLPEKMEDIRSGEDRAYYAGIELEVL